MKEYDSVEKYLSSVRDYKEQLSDPNAGLSQTEIRLGKEVKVKVLSQEEKKDEKVLLGYVYNDKEFLRGVFEKCKENEDLKKVSEEGFSFLTDR